MAAAELFSMRKLFSLKLFGFLGASISNGGARSSTSFSPSSSASSPLMKFFRSGRISTTRLQYQHQHQHRHKFTSVRCSSFGTSAVEASNGGGRRFLELTDQELMSQCEMDTFKASGPGGQHRNKRESAVRLKHLPTGIVAQGMQALLDLIFAVEGSVSDAAKYLGLSTGALSRLILSDDSLRMAVNELRASKRQRASPSGGAIARAAERRALCLISTTHNGGRSMAVRCRGLDGLRGGVGSQRQAQCRIWTIGEHPSAEWDLDSGSDCDVGKDGEGRI
ncbi:hypothetical protein TIFTF001_007906 [Ficus carica]|uniref:Prokaryotic-type class I peptide chain release factors domain-containing protein n=1 Tax=Ficus carica TaxID=3494 RepID=A0AA87ZR64_FICCA|nr:hypothetical protein TIFTF001_007906 [Ficus carica]